MNKKGFAISGIVYSILILFLLLLFAVLSMLGSRKLILDKLKNDVMNKLNNSDKVENYYVYKDTSGANSPILLNNMIPIRHDGYNWIYADVTKEWYDYEKQEWANGVILNEGVTKKVGDAIVEDEIALWYVWIPRYKYTIFNANNEGVPEQTINIVFETGTQTTGTVVCEDAINRIDEGNIVKSSEICTDIKHGEVTNGISTYTHPAFTFGGEKLTGFWIGKFEISTTDTTCNTTANETNCNKVHKLMIKPNVNSLRFTNVSNLFASIQNIDSDYEINGNSHMIKNMEWGAVAYLKQSEYGLGMTDLSENESYITGGGDTYIANINQSTTGNKYGVYDMKGSASEYVMGYMVNASNTFYSSLSGFEKMVDSKYYDAYTYDTDRTTYSRAKLGDAIKETMTTYDNLYGAWYNSYARLIIKSSPWMKRDDTHDGGKTGLFTFNYSTGSSAESNSSRAVAFK